MKTILFTSFLFWSQIAAAQILDSTRFNQHIDSSFQTINKLFSNQQFEEMLELSTSTSEYIFSNLSETDTRYPLALKKKADALRKLKNFEASEEQYQNAIENWEKYHDTLNLDYAQFLHSFALLYQTFRHYTKAEELYITSKNIRLEILGNEHPQYAKSLNNLGNVYLETGRLKKAAKLHEMALQVRRKSLGEQHPHVNLSLFNLGNIYFKMDNLIAAEKLYQESTLYWEKKVGKEHPQYALSLGYLARVYKALGRNTEAERLLIKRVNILEKTVGKEHPLYAGVLYDLGFLYNDIEYFWKAEPLFLEASEIWETSGQTQDKLFFQNQNQLANLYTKTGNYSASESLLKKSLSQRKEMLGKESHDYAVGLNDLGVLYAYMGKHEEAEKYFLESMRIVEKKFGDSSSPYSRIIHDLASFYMERGNFEKAEHYQQMVVAIKERVHGKKHFLYSSALADLAYLYYKKGNDEKAEPMLLDALSINEQLLNSSNASTLHILNTAGQIYTRKGEHRNAIKYYSKANVIEKNLLAQASRHFSERELGNYIRQFKQSQDLHCSIAQNLPSHSKVCFDNALYYKGFLLGTAARYRTIAEKDSDGAELFQELKSYYRQLSIEYAKHIGERNDVRALETKATAIEKELTRHVTNLGTLSEQIKWQDIRSQLKEGEATIEFIRYQVHYPKQTDDIKYVALLLVHNSDSPEFISLCDEKDLSEYYANNNQKEKEHINVLYGNGNTRLYQLLWQPLEKELAGINTIYFSSSDLLHRINLSAINDTEGTVLSSKYKFIQLNSTRQIATQEDKVSGSMEAHIFGGIQFDIDTSHLQRPIDYIADNSILSRGELIFDNTKLSQGAKLWPYLPWTEVEANAIQLILEDARTEVEIISGSNATEEIFKNIGTNKSSPRILHLATHGFFFPDPTNSQLSAVGSTQSEPIFKISDHPMIRSGLIMAGGNYAWENGKPFKPNMEDGILTAYEISQMNLSNTELVVLSACETGLGDIKGNEGVYGLQRAFKIAGAKYLIMSLWQVPDFQTQELMTAFYTYWLENKMEIPDAFRAAQKEMREKYEEPYLWAGFVLIQ